MEQPQLPIEKSPKPKAFLSETPAPEAIQFSPDVMGQKVVKENLWSKMVGNEKVRSAASLVKNTAPFASVMLLSLALDKAGVNAPAGLLMSGFGFATKLNSMGANFSPEMPMAVKNTMMQGSLIHEGGMGILMEVADDIPKAVETARVSLGLLLNRKQYDAAHPEVTQAMNAFGVQAGATYG